MSDKNASLEPLFNNDTLQFLFVGGKGGVGKTTCSSSVAIQFAEAKKKKGEKVLLISTDPAHNLSDAFLQQFNGEPQLVKGSENLYAMETDPEMVMESDLVDIAGDAKDGDEASDLVNDFREWIGSVPGIDEAMALSAVLKHVESGEFSLIVFDTAPTGHTLRLLQLPSVLKVGLEKLKSWRAKLGGVMMSMSSVLFKNNNAKTKKDAMKKLEQKLDNYQKDVTKITTLFKDKARTQFICVCIAEHLSVYETRRLCSELEEANIECKHILVNQLVPRMLANVTPETGGAGAVAEALKSFGVDLNTATAVREACELCGARARIQKHYLGVLQDALKNTHTTTLLPLLPAEVRGIENLTSFSQRFTKPDPKLLAEAMNSNEDVLFNPLSKLSDSMSDYDAITSAKIFKHEEEEEKGDEKEELEDGDAVEVFGLVKDEYNGLKGTIMALDPESGRYKVNVVINGKKKSLLLKPSNVKLIKKGASFDFPDAPSSNNGGFDIPAQVTPEMLQLVQKTLMKPGGFQELMKHPLVVDLKKDEQMLTFFNDFETKGVFGCFHYLQNDYVMKRLATVAKAIEEGT